jgi:hypothetical protein
MLGSLVGGAIILTNSRTLLKSDWIDAPDAVRYAVYAVIYAVWALAVAHSFRRHRSDRALQSAEATVAELNVAVEADRADDAQVPAGRPSAPRD